MEQEEYDNLMAYCCNGTVPNLSTKNSKDSFRKKAKKFVVKEGSLYFKGKSDIDLKVIASISDIS